MDIKLNVEQNDVDFIKGYLKKAKNPVELDDVVYQLALHKTKDLRKNRVLVYNPNCEYQVGDLIYKEYPGKIPVGSKKYIEMDRGVVLKVEDVWNRFGIEEIKLKYEGTSDFKKYTDYLERQKIELLLPHKQKKPCEQAEHLPEKKDPRKKQDPLVPKDFQALKKKVFAALHKEESIAIVSEKLLLTNNMEEIKPEVFNKVKAFLTEKKASESTEFLVENFLNIKPDSDRFNACCFALNYKMKTDYKIDFQQTKSKGWGKWNLISVIYYRKKNSIMSDENPLAGTVSLSERKNLSHRRKKFEEKIFDGDPKKYFLTQREVHSGALKLKPGLLQSENSIEIEALDTATKKTHTLYYYRDANLILGFNKVYQSYKALQGTTLLYEPVDDEKSQFSIRTTKKGTLANKIDYNEETKTFQMGEEKIASPVFVNKSMFLESDVITKIDERIDEFRNIATFNKLIHKVFIDFGNKEKNYEIHVLRLYHILDLVYPINLKRVEEALLGNPEFIQSEKMTGIFYLDSDAVVEIEEEEQQRRKSLVEEAKKRRDKIRQDKIMEEQKIQEEIRKKREEHRIKREKEMWMKERMKEERERKKIRQAREKVTKEPGRERRKVRPAATPIEKLEELPVEKTGGRKEHAKKHKKKVDVEKPLISKKKIDKAKADEKLDIDEIKKEIKLEELKEKVMKQKDVSKKVEKEKEIAYQDNGGFGGILASKLDEIVKKEDKEKPKTKKKTKKKGETK